MNTHALTLRTGSFATLMALLLVVMTTGCGSLMQRTANLEDDELYLGRGEEFITDAEYLAYAYEQAGYDAAGGEYAPRDSRGGDTFQSSFGYVPQSLRGRSMLRGYMTPYGAAGFGPNPYDPWGSSFYGGYSAYNPGFYDPYNPYGSPMGNLGWGSSAWGVNPYMGGSFGNGWGNNWGMNPYAYSPYGFNGYNPYNPYGAGGLYGGNNWGNAWGGGDVFDVNTVVVAPRTPIWTSSAVNSNGGGGRLLTNKVDEVDADGGTPAAPMTIWRGIDAVESKAASRATRQPRTAPTSPAYPNPARTTSESNGRSSYGSGNNSGRSSYGTSNSSRTTTRPSSTRNSSSRNSSWSGSSSGSSRSSGSRPSTRSSSGRSSGSSSGRSSGSSRGGRGGFPSR